MKALEGKVALVTGGSRGIGSAIALSLADHGADVAINYVSNHEAAQGVFHELLKRAIRAKAYACDVANAPSVNEMVGAILNDFGPVSILVNCAGITRDRTFGKMTRAQWDEVLSVNLGSVFNVTQSLLPSMMELGWGRIINISSVVGQWGNFGQSNYAASKGGMIAFTMSLARELARKNITVNAVAPGFIETDMTKNIPDSVKQAVYAATPLGRFGTPQEVSAAVAFLASPSAGYVTGQVIGVNGGMYM